MQPITLTDAISIITEANNKSCLLDILSRYKVYPEKIYGSNWSEPIRCPFPHHKNGQERVPSFGYCFTDDKFNCFGCQSFGKSVEFISLMEDKPKVFVAKKILENQGYTDKDIKIIDDENPKIEKLLMEMASFFREKFTSGDSKNVEKLEWWVDRFLIEKVPENKISVKELEARLERLKSI